MAAAEKMMELKDCKSPRLLFSLANRIGCLKWFQGLIASFPELDFMLW